MGLRRNLDTEVEIKMTIRIAASAIAALMTIVEDCKQNGKEVPPEITDALAALASCDEKLMLGVSMLLSGITPSAVIDAARSMVRRGDERH